MQCIDRVSMIFQESMTWVYIKPLKIMKENCKLSQGHTKLTRTKRKNAIYPAEKTEPWTLEDFTSRAGYCTIRKPNAWVCRDLRLWNSTSSRPGADASIMYRQQPCQYVKYFQLGDSKHLVLLLKKHTVKCSRKREEGDEGRGT